MKEPGSDLRERAQAYLSSIVGHEDPVEHVARWFAAIRAEAKAEGERAERAACMQIARDHHAPSVLRAIGDRDAVVP